MYGHLHSLTTEFTWLNPASMSHIRDPHHGAQRARWSEQLREGFRTHKELNRPENLDPGLFYPDGGESGSSILIASLSTGLTPTTQEPNQTIKVWTTVLHAITAVLNTALLCLPFSNQRVKMLLWLDDVVTFSNLACDLLISDIPGLCLNIQQLDT